ncbi:hypothetical protein [Microtetraspora glauca]|uniref:Uncharacterized protein n=1 Tax=Microtetraspora glauca TaxID=1996 RepID=A0ABV3GGS8_MICGL
MKAEISHRWGVIDLLDVLKDVAHVTDYTTAFTSARGSWCIGAWSAALCASTAR